MRSWSGANMQPKVEITTSKCASGNGSASASPSTQSISGAAARPTSSNSGVMSSPVTVAPVAPR